MRLIKCSNIVYISFVRVNQDGDENADESARRFYKPTLYVRCDVASADEYKNNLERIRRLNMMFDIMGSRFDCKFGHNIFRNGFRVMDANSERISFTMSLPLIPACVQEGSITMESDLFRFYRFAVRLRLAHSSVTKQVKDLATIEQVPVYN